MLYLKCIEKVRDKNKNIIKYKLKEGNRVIEIDPKSLKEAIIKKEITITNLKLTSNNKLIDDSSYNDLEYKLYKLKVLGYRIIEVSTNVFDRLATIYMCRLNNDLIILIPDEVKCIINPKDADESNYENTAKYFKIMKDTKGSIKVIGGKNLISADQMFSNCIAESIDVSQFDTSNIENMSAMFYMNKAKIKGIENFITKNTIIMGNMFTFNTLDSLDISNFDTKNLKIAASMFSNVKIKNLNMSGIKLNTALTIWGLFDAANIEFLNLYNFDSELFNEEDNIHTMFLGSTIGTIRTNNKRIINYLKKSNYSCKLITGG